MKVIEHLEDINDHIDQLVKWVIIIAMVIIPVVMVLQVILRYIFNYPLGWAEEAVRFCFVWLVFMSACAALRRGELVAMDFFLMRIGKRTAYMVTLIGRLGILIFLGTAIYSGYDMTAFVLGRGTNLPVLQLPLWIMYISLPAGCLFMLYQVLIHLIHQVRRTTPRPAVGAGLSQEP